ncbi:CMGC/CDK/CDK7 protein kinase [Dacryopinax primogenitus]|uniref:[RNA-polymerase]-subunit kinase n=1 Tax=Dacryopinax primogenitus (strain DJM 731) TaxID=1858805 RepID=M5G4B1_DACPD|nr:CMGC/CDK/CDK7 protein kinase [Dacryopinax primogenitus]EJU03529.1 CMGC/CDK/CDK7 protein kinase [Dacryopinax primogenitus]
MDVAERENLEAIRRYTKESKIGEGTFAVVYKGRQLSTGRPVAIKKIKVGQFRDGLDMTAIREVKFLQELKHPNVIELLDVYSNKSNLNLVLEFLDSDLEMIIKDRNNVFKPADIKSWMAMTCRGLEFCHRNWILHRDLKPNNLLLAANGELKIADFGLARDFTDPGSKMTCQVITRWYRPPELFYGCRAYGTSVDMWSVGCIFAELMLRVPYMAGESDLEQLKIIFRALGSPTEDTWPGHTKLPDYVDLGKFPKPNMQDLFTAASQPALDLMQKLLLYNPLQRISAKDALHHKYFTSLPHPTHPSKLPRTGQPMKARPLPIDELEGKGATVTGQGAAKKRKSTVTDDGRSRKVARKLEFK